MAFLNIFLCATFPVIGTSFAKPAGGLGPVFESVGDSRFDGHPLVEHFLDSIPSQRFHSDERLEQYTLNDHLPQSLNALQPTCSLLHLLGPTELNPSDIWPTVSSIRDGYHFPYEGNVLQPGAWPLQHHESHSKESQTIQSTGPHGCPPNLGIYAQSPHNLSPDEYPHADVSSLAHSSDHLMNSHTFNFETHRSNLALPEGSYNGQHLASGLMDKSDAPITMLTVGLKSPNSFRGEPLLQDSANPSQYLPNPKQLTSLPSPPDPGTAMEAAWRSDMGSGSRYSVSQDPHLIPHLEPAANSDITNYAIAVSDLNISNSSEGVVRPPADSIADASHTALDRFKRGVKKRKRPMVDPSEKRKQRREATIAKANLQEESFLDSRLAMGVRIANREHLVNPVPNRPSALSTFKPKPTLSEGLKKQELQHGLQHTREVRDPLDYFFVISTLRFPDHKSSRKYLEDLEQIFHHNFNPLSWPPKLQRKTQSSTTDRTNAIDPDAWRSLLIEICHRNMAFLWVFTPPESKGLRSAEQKRFSEWLAEQMAFDSVTTDAEKNEKIPIHYELSNYAEMMIATGHVLPPGWDVYPTPRQYHLEATEIKKISGMRTKCALRILANYYKAKNSAKWGDLFRNEKGFLRLFYKLKEVETNYLFSRYAPRKKDVEELQLFPWEDARRYTAEAIEKVLLRGTISVMLKLDIDNFVTKHTPGLLQVNLRGASKKLLRPRTQTHPES